MDVWQYREPWCFLPLLRVSRYVLILEIFCYCHCEEYLRICIVVWETYEYAVIGVLLLPPLLGVFHKDTPLSSRVSPTSERLTFIYFVSLDGEGVPWETDFAMEGWCRPWKPNVYRGRWILVVVGGYVSWKTVSIVRDEYVPWKTIIGHESQMFAVEVNMCWGANMCCRGLIYTVKDYLCRERRIYVAEGDLCCESRSMPLEVNMCHERRVCIGLSKCMFGKLGLIGPISIHSVRVWKFYTTWDKYGAAEDMWANWGIRMSSVNSGQKWY